MLYSTLETPIILLAFANDEAGSLRHLEQEKDNVFKAFQKAEQEGRCQIISLYPATPAKIIEAFLENRGRIRAFHYGGHSDADALFLHKDYPEQLGVKASSLAGFLATQPGLELAFLNGCLNLTQAKGYHQAGVRTVIATNHPVGDKAAQAFAQLFYQSLVGRATIEEAFEAAEKGFELQYSDLWRGIVLRGELSNKVPWQIFPQENRYWRLPLATRRLTRIPSIDFEREFLGRQLDLERLSNMLDSSPRVVLINGLGGIGKTVLATAFVQSQGGGYDNIAWINRGEDLVNSFALNPGLAETLGHPFQEEEDLHARFKYILWTLQQVPGRNLLVIDNAQKQITQKEIYNQLPGAPNWQVLLTSRFNLAGFDHLPLDTLPLESARELFRMHHQGQYSEGELEALLQEIGYHTLTIELLAKLLDKLNNIISVPKLTELLQQKQLNDPGLQEKVWARHSGEERGIYLHLIKAFELTRLTGREIWLLKQFVVLPVERYTVATLADFLQEKPLGLNKVLNSLADRGWLSLHEDKTFSIHRLIRQVVEYQLQPGFEDIKMLIESMVKKMSVDSYTHPLTDTVPWVNYATAVADFFNVEMREQVAALQNNIALTYRVLGQYKEALSFHQKARDIYEAVLDAKHPDLATFYNNIALTYRDLGQYKKALDYHQKAISIRRGMLEMNNPDLGTSYNNIAETYRDLGKYKEALGFHQKALSIRKAVLDANHPDLATSYNDIALTYRNLGQYEEALGFHQKAQAIWESVLDANHPDLATSYHNIAGAYRDLGQYKEALSYHKKDLTILESVLDSNHPHLASSYNNIALTYRKLNQYEEALDYHQKSLAILESTLDANHPHLAASYHNIALTCRKLGQYEEALGYNQKALAIRQSALEANHPDLGASYHNVALTYHALGQYEGALGYHQKAEAILGSVLDVNHPGRIEYYHNIALTYRALELEDKAKEYEAKAAAIIKKRNE